MQKILQIIARPSPFAFIIWCNKSAIVWQSKRRFARAFSDYMQCVPTSFGAQYIMLIEPWLFHLRLINCICCNQEQLYDGPIWRISSLKLKKIPQNLFGQLVYRNNIMQWAFVARTCINHASKEGNANALSLISGCLFSVSGHHKAALDYDKCNLLYFVQ